MSWPDPTKPVPHSSARCWGCSWPTVVVWCVLGIPDSSCGGGGTWPLVGRGARVVGDRHRTLVRNARAFGPGGWWYGGAIGAVRSSSPQRRCVVVAVGGSQRLCGWRLTSHACVQCQGLWARWTVVWGDALGAVRLPTRSLWCSVVAFGGLLPGCSTRSVSRASVQCEGFPWTQGVSRGGRVPHEQVGGSAPSHHCAGVGP